MQENSVSLPAKHCLTSLDGEGKNGNENCAGAVAACKLTKKMIKIRTPKSKVSRARNPERVVTL